MDSNRIDIFRITDFNIPLIILDDPQIKKEIYEDGARLTIPDLVGEYWLSAHLKEHIIGCYRVHAMGGILWQIHARILPKYRQMHAQRATKAAFLWCYKNIPDIKKIMAFVPIVHPNVALHAKISGMTLDGTIKESYLKNGKAVDQQIYSISTEKIEAKWGGELCQQPQL